MADPQSEPDLHNPPFPLVENMSPMEEPKEDNILTVNERPHHRRKRDYRTSKLIKLYMKKEGDHETVNRYYEKQNMRIQDQENDGKMDTWPEPQEWDYGKPPVGLNGNEDIIQEEPPNSPGDDKVMEATDDAMQPTPLMESRTCTIMDSSEPNFPLLDKECPNFSAQDREYAHLRHQDLVNSVRYSDEERMFLRHKVETFTREQCVVHCILGQMLLTSEEMLGNRLNMPNCEEARQALLSLSLGSHWDVYNLAIVCAFSEKLNVDKQVSKAFHGTPFFSSCSTFAPNAFEFRCRLTNFLRRLILE